MIDITNKNNGELLIFNVSGNCSFDEIKSAIISHYQTAQKLVLWDFGDSDLSGLTNEQIQRVASIVSRHASHEKTAYVGNTNLEYGLLNMYRSFAEITGIAPQPKVFRHNDDALAWLYSSTDDPDRS